MIGYVRGEVLVKHGNTLIIDTGGVGYELSVPVSVIEQTRVGIQTALFVHHNVREDGHYLFGFSDLAQRQLFRELIRVSGIGPKIALLILSGFSVSAFMRVVQEQNSAALVKLPGVGKKTAERLLIELTDRVGKSMANWMSDAPDETTPESSNNTAHHAMTETEEALVALGYKAAAAATMVQQAWDTLHDDSVTTDQLLREVLRRHVPRGTL